MEGRQSKIIYVDIDGTICTISKPYSDAKPIPEHIEKINKLYDEGHQIIYYTARGAVTKVDYSELTKKQLNDWGCKHHMLRMNHKPNYDLFICDKSKRIEEI
jgi:histidinol phosphatase-like enzyme